ncbi:MAG: hypothetical protein CL606_04925 [Anaerolineaceae bacterium]|nr:hypothetical protein [Anaerolineaceae bacterium]
MNITVVSSSTRKVRRSHRVALAVVKQIKVLGHQASIVDLIELDLPSFVERFGKVDDATGKLAHAADTMRISDGMIFLTPEYNGAMSSGLKNFIDVFAKASFEGKPIGVATVSVGASGGIRAAYQLQQTILSILAYPIPRMLTVGNVEKVIDESGQVTSQKFQTKLDEFLDSYLAFVSKF